MPYKAVKQPILPYFQIYIHFMKPFEEIFGIISFVIPGIWSKQKDNKSAARSPRECLGNWEILKLLQICTGID